MSIRTAVAAIVATGMIAAGPATLATAQEQQGADPAQQGAQAQQDAPVQMQPSQAPSPEDFTAEQISLFAEAYVEIRDIGRTYQPDIQAAANEDERRTLIEEAQTEMVAVIEGIEGLTVEDYNGINAAAQANQDFAAEVQAEIESVGQG